MLGSNLGQDTFSSSVKNYSSHDFFINQYHFVKKKTTYSTFIGVPLPAAHSVEDVFKKNLCLSELCPSDWSLIVYLAFPAQAKVLGSVPCQDTLNLCIISQFTSVESKWLIVNSLQSNHALSKTLGVGH